MKKTLVLFTALLNLSICSQYINSYQYKVTWTEQYSGVLYSLNSVSSAQFGDGKYGWVCGDGGTVLRTSNEGENWTNVGLNGIPSNITLNTIANIGGNIALTAGNIGNVTYVYRTSNNGLNWTLVFSQDNGKINAISLSSFGNCYMQGNPVGGRWSLWKSTDIGVTWDSTGMYLAQQNNETGFRNSFYTSITYSYSRLWFGTNNSKVYYSSNSGSSWTAQTVPEQNIYTLSLVGSEGLIGGNNLLTTNNFGSSWTPQVSPGTGIINGVLIMPIIIAIPNIDAISGYPVFYTRNNSSIYFNNNSAENWELSYEAPLGSYNHINSSGLNVWAVRNEGGISYGKVDILTVVNPNNYPYSFELRQNYPNPFNPKTKIPIYIYKTTKIKLNVYNSEGKLVWNYTNVFDPIGIYDSDYYGLPSVIEWDGTNYPSGVYFYQVIADDYTATRKMMLVK